MQQLFLIDRWVLAELLFAERKGMFADEGGGGGGKYLSPTSHPTQAWSLLHLCDICTLHDIKAMWIYVEQSPGL